MVKSEFGCLSHSQNSSHCLLTPLHGLSLEISLLPIFPDLELEGFSRENMTHKFRFNRFDLSMIISQKILTQSPSNSSISCQP